MNTNKNKNPFPESNFGDDLERKPFDGLTPKEWFIKHTDLKEAQAQAESNWEWRLERSDLGCLIPYEDVSDLEDMANDPMSYVKDNEDLWKWLMNNCLNNWFHCFANLVEYGAVSEEEFAARLNECYKAVKPNYEKVARWVKRNAKYALEEFENN